MVYDLLKVKSFNFRVIKEVYDLNYLNTGW